MAAHGFPGRGGYGYAAHVDEQRREYTAYSPPSNSYNSLAAKRSDDGYRNGYNTYSRQSNNSSDSSRNTSYHSSYRNSYGDAHSNAHGSSYYNSYNNSRLPTVARYQIGTEDQRDQGDYRNPRDHQREPRQQLNLQNDSMQLVFSTPGLLGRTMELQTRKAPKQESIDDLKVAFSISPATALSAVDCAVRLSIRARSLVSMRTPYEQVVMCLVTEFGITKADAEIAVNSVADTNPSGWLSSLFTWNRERYSTASRSGGSNLELENV